MFATASIRILREYIMHGSKIHVERGQILWSDCSVEVNCISQVSPKAKLTLKYNSIIDKLTPSLYSNIDPGKVLL